MNTSNRAMELTASRRAIRLRIFSVAALVSLAVHALSSELLESYSSEGKAGGKHYEFKITRSEVANTPIWPSDTENPPLSPRRAQEIARTQLNQLLGPDSKEWLLREIMLGQMGDDIHWEYLVTFEPPPLGHAGEANPDFMRIIVLMSGKVVNPTITPISP